MLTPDDSRRLAHLLRRAGFGARPEEWDQYAALGLGGATQSLLHPENTPDHLDTVLQDIQGDYVDFDNIESIRNWWMFRMAHTQRPLEEKMTLFWHGHFATAFYKVENPRWMWQQNELFRTHALGNFRTMLQAVSRDPAMLVWLDSDENRKGRANENYGRELLELFTMGVGGGYTENEVKQGARAFTGWGLDRDTNQFYFNADLHDDGMKTFLGNTGRLNGDDIIDIVVRHPSTANFISTKLFRFFVHADPAPSDIAPLAATYFRSGYDIRAVVEAILVSPTFYSDRAIYGRIKSPVEYAMTTVRALDMPLGVENGGLPAIVRGMGQDLFNPPNVKGWPGERVWINTMTMTQRVNFASRVIQEMGRRGVLDDNIRTALHSSGVEHLGDIQTPEAAVDAIWQMLLPGYTISPDVRATLASYVTGGQPGAKVNIPSKMPGLITLVLSSPEYQMA